MLSGFIACTAQEWGGASAPKGALGPQEADAIDQAQLEVDGSDGIVVVLRQLEGQHCLQVGLQQSQITLSASAVGWHTTQYAHRACGVGVASCGACVMPSVPQERRETRMQRTMPQALPVLRLISQAGQQDGSASCTVRRA